MLSLSQLPQHFCWNLWNVLTNYIQQACEWWVLNMFNGLQPAAQKMSCYLILPLILPLCVALVCVCSKQPNYWSDGVQSCTFNYFYPSWIKQDWSLIFYFPSASLTADSLCTLSLFLLFPFSLYFSLKIKSEWGEHCQKIYLLLIRKLKVLWVGMNENPKTLSSNWKGRASGSQKRTFWPNQWRMEMSNFTITGLKSYMNFVSINTNILQRRMKVHAALILTHRTVSFCWAKKGLKTEFPVVVDYVFTVIVVVIINVPQYYIISYFTYTIWLI